VGPFVVLAVTWATAACGSTPDCFDIHPGNRVAITIVAVYENYPYVTQFPCVGFDITQGLTLIATDLGNPGTYSEGTCNSAAVAIEPFAAWTWTATGPLTGGSDPTVLTGSFNATNGTCTGFTSMDVIAEYGTPVSVEFGQPFATVDGGQGPNVVMERTFTARGDGGAGCPSICSDTFSVTLKRL